MSVAVDEICCGAGVESQQFIFLPLKATSPTLNPMVGVAFIDVPGVTKGIYPHFPVTLFPVTNGVASGACPDITSSVSANYNTVAIAVTSPIISTFVAACYLVPLLSFWYQRKHHPSPLSPPH
eukprot:9887468-Ditylum_brightwellii.AAC.4